MTEEKTTEVAGTQILTIDPAKYVAAIFAPFVDRLAAARADAVKAAETMDVSTKPGMAVAITQRATFRAIRIEAENARKARKAPILEIGRLLDSRHEEIEAEVKAIENKFDAAIKAEEKRIEDEKQARIIAEQNRVAAIRARIAVIERKAIDAMDLNSEQIGKEIAALEEMPIDESFAEFKQDVAAAKIAALHAMEKILKSTIEAEEREKQAEADRKEFERLKAEDSARREREAAEAAERDRIAREKAEADAKAAAEKLACEQAEHAERMRLDREKLEREQADARAKMQAEIDAAAKQAAEVKAKAEAEAAERRRAEDAREAAAAEARAAEQRRIDDERARLAKIAEEQAAADRERQAAEQAKAEKLRESAGALLKALHEIDAELSLIDLDDPDSVFARVNEARRFAAEAIKAAE